MSATSYTLTDKGTTKKTVSTPSLCNPKVTMMMLKFLQILKTVIWKQFLFCHLNSFENW